MPLDGIYARLRFLSNRPEESPMQMTTFFAEQLEREMPISRRVLEQAPAGRADWKPHEKSMQFGYLANLVATMPSWIAMAIEQDELDLNPPGGGAKRPTEWKTNAELLGQLDAAVSQARAALAGTTDAHLKTNWKLLVGGHVVMESPRHTVIADTFTHLAHHRGQLTVYLRLNDAKVPSVYGPSADDQRF
jgi:uncharacterized damage-inducible protein DinB